MFQGAYCNAKDPGIKFYQADRDDFLSVDNWKEDNEFERVNVLDIHRIPCKFYNISLDHYICVSVTIVKSSGF